MQVSQAAPQRGFTLIELLAVIAIIALLIGLLVPAVSNVRDQARKASTAGQLDAVGKGCEAFHAETGAYPRSQGKNPFEPESGNVDLTGAQWLVVQLVGPDFQGYVEPEVRNDTNNDGVIDARDWVAWYSPRWTGTATRLPPYLDVSGKIAQSPELYAREGGLTLPDRLQLGSSLWSNPKVPFLVDAFRFPVLYYRANAQARHPFAEWSGSTPRHPGRYDQVDNEIITGSEGAEDGWDLGAGLPRTEGGMYKLGWSDSSPNTAPEPKTFAHALYDRVLFEQTRQGTTGKVWPHRPDTFILISPGKDGLYGTSDDVTNF